MVETLGRMAATGKLLFAILASVLLLSLGLVMSESIPRVNALSVIHQGDLILDGNNVTVIEGQFDINGSIIVENNATLILENTVLNFTQSRAYQYNMTFRNPAGGTPRLQAQNATITSGVWVYLILYIYGNSTVTANNLTIPDDSGIQLYVYDSSVISFSKSHINSLYVFGEGVKATISASQVNAAFIINYCNVLFSDTLLNSLQIRTNLANFSVFNFNLGAYESWAFLSDCSVLVAPGGYAPNVTLSNSQLNDLEFIGYDSNVTLGNTTLALQEYGSCSVRALDWTITYLGIHDSSAIWIVNPETVSYGEMMGSFRIYLSYYLDVHVLDSIDQNVPSATVSAFYPNSTLAESETTNSSGWTRLTLMEKLVNATGSYPVGDYNVSAAHLAYSSFADVNMNRSQRISLTLSGLIIPEFPSFLILPLMIAATLLAVTLYKKKEKLSRATCTS